MSEMLGYQFVQNAIAAGLLASLLCGLVGTFVVVKRLVFVSGGVSHAAFGGLGIFYYLGWPPLAGAAASALLAAFVLAGGARSAGSSRGPGRSQDTLIGILWAVGMAVGVLFMARTPGFAPNLATYLFGDILAVSRPLLVALAAFVGAVVLCVSLFFKELLAVAFDEEFARSQGVRTRTFLITLMVLIALSVVLLIQVVGVILAIALLTIPPVISLSVARSFRSVIALAILVAVVMTMAGLAVSFAWDLPSGPTIVLLGFVLLLAVKLARSLGRRRLGSSALAAVVGLATTLVPVPTATAAAPDDEAPTYLTPIRHLEFLGEARLDPMPLDGVPVGGLSGLAYDAETGLYYAISDDRAQRGPARFYSLEIDLSDGRLESGDARVVGFTRLRRPDGDFGRGRIDPEAIALTPSRTLIVASEGDARIGLPPFLREFDLDGRELRDLPLGRRYAPRRDRQAGVRNNMALESAAMTPGGRFVFSAPESALAQDGPKADLRTASPGRILRYDLEGERIDAEYLYWIDPVTRAPEPRDQFSTAGLVDLIALDDDTLLVLERSFSVGRGNDVRLYEAELTGATDILTIDSLERRGLEDLQAVRKRLLLDVNRLGVAPDNLEGMALGPLLSDGRATLLLISDDNFNPVTQVTQLLVFALSEQTPTVPAVQGTAHRSPFEGDWLRGLSGVVTAVDRRSGPRGFWIQVEDGDGDVATSDGLWVAWPEAGVASGDLVRLDGAVREDGADGELTVTRLDAARVEVVETGRPLPEPVVLGRDGRAVPTVVIDDDRLEHFDPCCDGIDFYESLEGMRAEVRDALAVAGTSRYGEIVVVGDGGWASRAPTGAGGLLLRPGDPNPERLVLDDRLVSPPPAARVGQRFTAPIRGVVDYAFASYKIQVDAWPSSEPPASTPSLPGPESEAELSIASFNTLNLDGLDPPERFRRLAGQIVDALHSPAILGLQEIQDDNGAADGGVVSAEKTLERLTEAIEGAGGPDYRVLQIDPAHNADGGEPNGNIRVVWLFDPARVALDNPRRVAAESAAFAGDPARGWEGGRKCLAVDARIDDEILLLVNCHLKSKRGDDRLFGAHQPPRRRTEEQRSAQVREILRLVDDRLRSEPGTHIVVLGDMNERELRAPMRLLTSRGLVGLMDRVPESERYSFNFVGNSQLLDHILVSRSLVDRVTQVAIVHVNADLPATRQASDHDPVLVRLRRRRPAGSR